MYRSDSAPLKNILYSFNAIGWTLSKKRQDVVDPLYISLWLNYLRLPKTKKKKYQHQDY